MWQTETDGGGGCVCVCVCVSMRCVYFASSAQRAHADNTMSVEKKSLRRIMYAPARSPKPRVSLHLVFNCYKLSHLTPSSLPFYNRPAAIDAGGRPTHSQLSGKIGFQDICDGPSDRTFDIMKPPRSLGLQLITILIVD